MTLWFLLAMMTSVALFAVIWPFVRQIRSTRPGGEDAAVYRDQLDELERDRATGLIGAVEAAEARVEISRRLLAAVDFSKANPSGLPSMPTDRRRRFAIISSLLTVPIVACALYLRLGSPELASGPTLEVSATAASELDSVDSLVAQAEAHLQRNPQDGSGWEVLAPVYMRLDRYSDAVGAWRNALRLLGENAERDANLGEALTAEANGIVTAEAKSAFMRATSLDNTSVTARYYLGLAAEQDGKRSKAAEIWRELVVQAPADAFWLDEVRSALARVEHAAPVPAPIEAASNQPPEQEQATIRGMVDRLAARLENDGTDVDGWLHLIRAYMVLGESDKESAATAKAKQALTGDSGKLQKLDAGLKELNADNVQAPSVANFGAAQTAMGGAPPDHEHGVMTETVVDRLANRLKDSGSDPEGWLMLVRSYLTLGEKDKAAAAIGTARKALASDPDKLARFNKALSDQKIGVQ